MKHWTKSDGAPRGKPSSEHSKDSTTWADSSTTTGKVRASVVIVTHNSESHLEKNAQHLLENVSASDRVILVDSGSEVSSYLDAAANGLRRRGIDVRVIVSNANIGFSKANNMGAGYALRDSEFILFLNPDAYLPAGWIDRAVCEIRMPIHERVGAITGPLLGYSALENRPTGLIDSLGILRKWYGRWYDDAQGDSDAVLRTLTKSKELPAICGALMFCRAIALQSVLDPGRAPFDESFFMYKEDIELSLRLREAGWKLLLIPSLVAYHCRGWKKARKEMPKLLRQNSALNELRIHVRHRSLAVIYSLTKYLYVRFFE